MIKENILTKKELFEFIKSFNQPKFNDLYIKEIKNNFVLIFNIAVLSNGTYILISKCYESNKYIILTYNNKKVFFKNNPISYFSNLCKNNQTNNCLKIIEPKDSRLILFAIRGETLEEMTSELQMLEKKSEGAIKYYEDSNLGNLADKKLTADVLFPKISSLSLVMPSSLLLDSEFDNFSESKDYLELEPSDEDESELLTEMEFYNILEINDPTYLIELDSLIPEKNYEDIIETIRLIRKQFNTSFFGGITFYFDENPEEDLEIRLEIKKEKDYYYIKLGAATCEDDEYEDEGRVANEKFEKLFNPIISKVKFGSESYSDTECIQSLSIISPFLLEIDSQTKESSGGHNRCYYKKTLEIELFYLLARKNELVIPRSNYFGKPNLINESDKKAITVLKSEVRNILNKKRKYPTNLNLLKYFFDYSLLNRFLQLLSGDFNLEEFLSFLDSNGIDKIDMDLIEENGILDKLASYIIDDKLRKKETNPLVLSYKKKIDLLKIKIASFPQDKSIVSKTIQINSDLVHKKNHIFNKLHLTLLGRFQINIDKEDPIGLKLFLQDINYLNKNGKEFKDKILQFIDNKSKNISETLQNELNSGIYSNINILGEKLKMLQEDLEFIKPVIEFTIEEASVIIQLEQDLNKLVISLNRKGDSKNNISEIISNLNLEFSNLEGFEVDLQSSEKELLKLETSIQGIEKSILLLKK